MFFAGFVFLGLLVGYLAGLSSSPVASTLLAAIFSLAGGTVVHYTSASKLDRKLAGGALVCFSAFCAIGLTFGIVVKENRLLTSVARQKDLAQIAPTSPSGSRDPYLKSAGFASTAASIHQQYVAGEITAAQAYDKLSSALEAKQ